MLDELKCFSCGYELRGLTGNVVTCPECGRQHNVTNMIIKQWNGPWYRAPGFKLLGLPLLAPVAWCFVMGACGLLFINSPGNFTAVFWVATLGAVVGWFALMYRALTKYRRRIGIVLTVMVQLIFPLYTVGLFSVFVIPVMIYFEIDTGEDVPVAVFAVCATVAGFMFLLAYGVQRIFARLCIRTHVRRLSDEGTIRP